MSKQFNSERELQGQMEALLASALPMIDVLDIELDQARESVRVFIDHPEGVTVEKCVEVNDVIRDTCPDYSLEVSSPGLERPLRHARHFEGQIGEKVRLRESGKKRASIVEIVAVDDTNGVTVLAHGDEERTVPFESIVRCKLVEKPAQVDGVKKKQRGSKRKGRA